MCFVDLNLRTTASNGVWSVRQTFKYARAYDLTLFSITDEDLPQDLALPADLADRYIPGLRLHAQMESRMVNLLVYGSIPSDSRLAAALAQQRARRHECTLEVLLRLIAQGVAITLDDILIEGGSECTSFGRFHVARALVSLGEARSVEHAFQTYLDEGRSCHVAFQHIPAAEAIEMAHANGAVVVVANPLPLESSAELEHLRRLGIDGIETRHASIEVGKSERLEQYAKASGLLISGGSGSGNSSPHVPVHFVRERVDDLLRAVFANAN